MYLVLENNVNCLIWSPIYIIDQHRYEQFAGVKIVLVNKGLTDKKKLVALESIRAHKGSLGDVSNVEGNRKVQESTMDIKSINNRVQKKFFPIQDNKQEIKELAESESQIYLLGHCL